MSKNTAEFIAKRDEDDLRSILKTIYGKRFISRLLISTGVNRTGVDFDNALLTYFNAGMRSIGNALMNEVIRINPEAYNDMRKMDKEDEDARKSEREQDKEDE
jgi:hypothetical protein